MNRVSFALTRAVCAASVLAVAVAGVPASPAQRGHDRKAPETRRFDLGFKLPHVPGELLVKLRDASDKRALDTIDTAGLRVQERSAAVPSLVRVAGGDDAAALATATELAANPAVEYVEPNYLCTTLTAPNDPNYGRMWGLNQSSGIDIGAESAWDRTTGSDTVVIGVIDTGMDTKHVDLKDNLFKNQGEIPNNGIDDDGNGYVDDVNGWDAVTDTGNIKDEDGHGTHVSGTIGARGDNGIGVTGVNWKVKLLPLRFIRVENGSTFDAIQCIDYATKLRQSGVNLRVLNNSWGSPGNDRSLQDAIQRANDAGILFVCAAGNDAKDTDASPNYPSSFDVPNVISVGAMAQADFAAGFSNHGLKSVDLYAPGDNIYSTIPGDGYGSLSGTSQATPHVSGIAGLIVALNPNVTIAAMKARILGSAISDRFATPLCLTGARASAANAVKTDAVGPGDVSDFRLASVSRTTVVVTWTSVADDGASGNAAAYYDIRWSTSQISSANWDDATQLDDSRMPLRPGMAETAVVKGCFAEDEPVYVAMRVYDKAANFTQTETLVAEPTGTISTFAVQPGPDTDFELGTPLDLKADDAAMAVELPFDFPFFGSSYRTAYVSTNGLISFGTAVTGPSTSDLTFDDVTAIAPLWLDLTTDGSLTPSENVYFDTTASTATIRWVAEPFYEEGTAPTDLRPVTFSATLHEDGHVDFDYGPGNNRGLVNGASRPIVGVSDGGCASTVVLGYSGQSSLADAPPISLRVNSGDDTDSPRITAPSSPSFSEGSAGQFTVGVNPGSGGTPTITASLPRNATFDAATGVAHFTPDSTQGGPVQFVFLATDPAGRSSSKVVVVNVSDNGNLPEVKYLQVKKKVTFVGIGYRVGAHVEIDGADVGDAKSNKKAPATKITSANARTALASPGQHTIVVVNPDGTRSGPSFAIR